jgi:putative hydrolase of the HAD superfamily
LTDNQELKLMPPYRHLYFDLDRTLWDYDTNASQVLFEIFNEFKLQPIFETFDIFKNAFIKYNDTLWVQYQKGILKKETLRIRRFELALLDFKTKNKKLAIQLNDTFIHRCPRKTALITGTNEILEYLKKKSYHLYILTNGFTQIQYIKMESSGLNIYFEKVFTSENTKSFKPKRAIFEQALKSVNARKADSIMIGDNLEVDILGARNFGMDQVYFNPGENPHKELVTYEIMELIELKNIL